MNLSTQMNDEPLEIPAGLFADRPGKNSRFSGSTASSNTSTDPHAKTFGLSLAAVLAACLVLNAASPSTRICQQPDRDFGTTTTDSASASKRIVLALGGGSRAEPSKTIRSKECATNEGGEEPGY
jgi:glycine/D-amino acid oxidase-like deaminating enzyme